MVIIFGALVYMWINMKLHVWQVFMKIPNVWYFLLLLMYGYFWSILYNHRLSFSFETLSFGIHDLYFLEYY